MNKSYPSLIEILFETQKRHALMRPSFWINIKDLTRDFLRLQSLIISYWSTSCTANCSRICV